MSQEKTINYLNKDFNAFKQALVDFTKVYFPSTFNDFTEASPGMMFMEQASYVGDVLSYYLDNQIQNNFIQLSKQKENVLNLSYMLGYRPKVTTAAGAKLDVFQLVPAVSSGSLKVPDFSYALTIAEGSQIKSRTNPDISFYVRDSVDFSISSSFNPTTVSIFQLNTTSNQPEYFLLNKKVDSFSGTVKTTTFDFGAPIRFPVINITDTNVIEIISVLDSNGNRYYEVPYLAQETIFDEVNNIASNDPNLAQYNNTTPYLLKLRKVPRRFVSRFRSDNTLDLEFGPGVSSNPDEIIIPNPDNVGIGLVNGLTKIDVAFDPSNFLYTKTYGQSPFNTTLTINYLVGGGVGANVPSNDLTVVDQVQPTFREGGLDSIISNYVLNSLAFTNTEAASGGKDGDSLEDMRLNSLAAFPTQLRTVNREDFIVRALSLPSKYGAVAKAYIVPDDQLSQNLRANDLIEDNPLSVSLYILSFDNQKKLSQASSALKQNLKTYLSQYRLLTDAVNIKDAFVINIGVNFDVIVKPNVNGREVLLNCIQALTNYFDIDKWSINQPIMLGEIYTLLDNITGVQSVSKIDIVNKQGTPLYSAYGYDIVGATFRNIIYPSLDPSIFAISDFTQDIKGRIVSL